MPFYNWSEMERSVISPQYSTAEGPTIKGGKIEVGRYRFAALFHRHHPTVWKTKPCPPCTVPTRP